MRRWRRPPRPRRKVISQVANIAEIRIRWSFVKARGNGWGRLQMRTRWLIVAYAIGWVSPGLFSSEPPPIKRGEVEHVSDEKRQYQIMAGSGGSSGGGTGQVIYLGSAGWRATSPSNGTSLCASSTCTMGTSTSSTSSTIGYYVPGQN